MTDDIERDLMADGTSGPRPRPWEEMRASVDARSDILDMAWLAICAIEQTAKGSYVPPSEPGEGSSLRAFALRQYEQQYPLVIQQALVSLWGSIETTVERTAIDWLERNPELLCGKAFSKLRVRAAELLSLDERERTCMLIEELDRSLADSCPAGIERLEAVLSSIDLGGKLDGKIRNALVELYQIRNLYVHKGGRADRHFKRICPWRREKIGDPVRVLPSHIYGYSILVSQYANSVLERLFAKLGMSFDESPPDVLKYPNATSVGQVARMTDTGPSCIFVFSTSDAIPVVLKHYRTALADWNDEGEQISDPRPTLRFTNPNGKETAVISARTRDADGLTEFSIQHIIAVPKTPESPEDTTEKS